MKMMRKCVVGVVEELVDKPGTTNGTYFILLVRCGFCLLGPVVGIPMIASRDKELREFLQEASPRISPFL